MRQYSNDLRLWALATGCLFTACVVARLVFTGVGDVGRFLVAMPVLWLACIPAGWALHALAVVCGARFPRFAAPPDAADYDDTPPPG
jgi:hypothetical protein